jgi:hypothetical protein
MSKCNQANCTNQDCVYSFSNFGQYDFKDVFYNDSSFVNILKNSNYAKFILLDQYGFSQVDEDVFLKLVEAPKTDFIFFISSSFIRRFKEHPAVQKYFDTERIPCDETKPRDCHRQIADYYQGLFKGKNYYLHNFTIKNGANYWGLIFGTNHSLGMEKFLKVCWNKDRLSGEANFNINDDFPSGSLFYTEEGTNKKEKAREKIRSKIISEEIKDNIIGLQFTLKLRCLPEVFVDVIKELEKTKLILCTPKSNRQATNIHKADKYQIEVIKK